MNMPEIPTQSHARLRGGAGTGRCTAQAPDARSRPAFQKTVGGGVGTTYNTYICTYPAVGRDAYHISRGAPARARGVPGPHARARSTAIARYVDKSWVVCSGPASASPGRVLSYVCTDSACIMHRDELGAFLSRRGCIGYSSYCTTCGRAINNIRPPVGGKASNKRKEGWSKGRGKGAAGQRSAFCAMDTACSTQRNMEYGACGRVVGWLVGWAAVGWWLGGGVYQRGGMGVNK